MTREQAADDSGGVYLMSKIQKALERAKLLRAGRGGGEPLDLGTPVGGGLPRPGVAEDAPPAVSPAPWDARTEFDPVTEAAPEGNFFTQTRVVEVPESLLKQNKVFAIEEGHPINESFKLLRTRILQTLRPNGWNTIQITGFGSGEGKSTLAANLALSMCKDARQTTLLVDLNFRNPTLDRLFGFEPGCRGLRSYFQEGIPLREILVSPGISKMTVLPAGGVIENATELMGSPQMEKLVRELKQRYPDRIVIFDTPGLSLYPDSLVFSDYVDTILVVARAGKTSKTAIRNAMELLPRRKILGSVFNGVDNRNPGS